MRLLATIRPETRDPERYQCLRCGIWRVKKSGRSTRYSDDRATLYGGAHFQAVMARQRHERVVLLAAWREGRL